MSGVTLGLDLGTSGLKGVLLDETATVVAAARAGYRTSRPGPGRAEQRPADWLRAIERVCGALGREVPPRRWGAIGLSGMIPTLVLADARGEAIGPAITWEDGRAEPQAASLRRRAGARALAATTGQWVDGRYLLPMWMWVAEHEPERAAAARWVLGAKDLVLRWLTGEVATDPSTASGSGCFDLRAGRWERAVASLAGVGGRGMPGLPRIAASASTLPLAADAAERLGLRPGVPVAVGAADSVLSADALGGPPGGGIAYVAGTSTVLLAFLGAIEPDPRHRFLITPATRPRRWGYEMDLLSTGSALRWWASVLGIGSRGESRLLALAERAAPGEDPVFLPYVAPGEQGALWDPTLRGSIEGLTLRHGPEHLARALVDGIVLESRRCVAILRSKGAASTIHATGGAAGSRWFRRRLADATGCAVVRAGGTAGSAAAVGAAALTDPELGRALAERAAASAVATAPDPAEEPAWRAAWERHEAARRRRRRES